MNRKMTENNVKQAMVPKDAIVMYNDNGTAPGIIIENKDKILIMMPGPPKEMKPMFSEQVKPYLAGKQEYTLVSRTLRIAGVGESSMETRVKDIIDSQTNPTIAPYAKETESVLRVTAKAKTAEEAEKLIEPMAEEIYSRFGINVYAEGETTMQETVAKMLIDSKTTIAVAESCTGGLVAAKLIEYPGISEVLIEGAVTYTNDAKMRRLGVKKETLDKYGAVSPQTAAEMAEESSGPRPIQRRMAALASEESAEASGNWYSRPTVQLSPLVSTRRARIMLFSVLSQCKKRQSQTTRTPAAISRSQPRRVIVQPPHLQALRQGAHRAAGRHGR